MKKKILILVSLVLMVCLSVCMVSCYKNGATLDNMIDLSKIDYKQMDVAKGLDSVDVFNKALDYMKNCDNFAYTVLFNFATEPALAVQSNKEVIRKNGKKVLHEQVTVGKGLGESHYAVIRLHDGNTSKVVKNDVSNKGDAKKRVPGFSQKDESKIFDYDLDGIAPVKLEGDIPDYEYCKNYKTYAEYMLNRAQAYIWFYNYGANDLAKEHDSKVYVKDNMYYCDITIDTKNCLSKGNQPDVIKDIQQGVGMEITGFNTDTVLRLQLEKVDDSFRFIATNLVESYKASVAKANQTYFRVFSYDSKDYTITKQHTKLFA